MYADGAFGPPGQPTIGLIPESQWAKYGLKRKSFKEPFAKDNKSDKTDVLDNQTKPNTKSVSRKGMVIPFPPENFQYEFVPPIRHQDNNVTVQWQSFEFADFISWVNHMVPRLVYSLNSGDSATAVFEEYDNKFHMMMYPEEYFIRFMRLVLVPSDNNNNDTSHLQSSLRKLQNKSAHQSKWESFNWDRCPMTAAALQHEYASRKAACGSDPRRVERVESWKTACEKHMSSAEYKLMGNLSLTKSKVGATPTDQPTYSTA